MLAIDTNGVITYNGQPYGWADFFQTGIADVIPYQIWWQQIGEAFTFNGTTYARFDYLVRYKDGSFKAMTQDQFNKTFTKVSGAA